MSITKYKIKRRFPEAKIEAIEVERETELSVWVRSAHRPHNVRRELKMTDWEEIYDTWEEAHTVLAGKVTVQISDHTRRLEEAKALLAAVNEMVKP